MAKTITIKNPWAHLIAKGVKDVENRAWRTDYRGKVLIHSSQVSEHSNKDTSQLFTSKQWKAISHLDKINMVNNRFPCSAVIP